MEGGRGHWAVKGWEALCREAFERPVQLSAASQGFRDLLSTGSPGPTAADSPGPERSRSEMPTYVNIPISPPSRPQLHYLGLEFSGASGSVRGGFPHGVLTGEVVILAFKLQEHQHGLEGPSSSLRETFPSSQDP